MRRRLASLAIVASLLAPAAAAAQSPARPEVLLRIDDIGMNHSKNLALAELAKTGMPLSASVMFATPWYQEAVEILRANPHISVGVHLTLNSEWKGYRWGPVLGAGGVPSLVDSVGYFHSSTRGFLQTKYDLGEVERELSAQLDRAMKSGLRVDFIDPHMGTATATPELRAVVERLAERYKVAISRYYGEKNYSPFSVAPEEKTRHMLAKADSLAPGTVTLVVLHVARATPEMNVLVDMNNAAQNTATGEAFVARHRNAELDALLSPEWARLRASGRVGFITYADLIARQGRAGMKRPLQP